MKCTNKLYLSFLLICLFVFTGCSSPKIELAYSLNSNISAFSVISNNIDTKTDAFAQAICVGNVNKTEGTVVNMSKAGAAALFDINSRNIIYSKNLHQRLQPASLTKVLTALVALEEGNPDDIIKVTAEAKVTESGATLCGLEEGDTLTMNQALHALLISSANDAANAIAIHLGGSIDGFSVMMNEKARQLGATNSNFVNPHGLSHDDHYTTVYDLYLIFNQAIQHENFNEIIHMTEYQTEYQDRDGVVKEMDFSTTNLFLRGQYDSPNKVTVIGGKTGTTNAAGNCLILLSKDTSGNPYISVILKSEERAMLYEQMIDLLGEIYN
ncbi:MAG: D-alanyl-D-alanine carboxypeptidase [Lachnospiraceae bacterium]|nr:D-alanyl-D-alanine carboxypeptidase [Lachnospiraceae bacterium]